MHQHQVVIQHIEEAHRQIDEAISAALLHKKPVYIEVGAAGFVNSSIYLLWTSLFLNERKLDNHNGMNICLQISCNIANLTHPSFGRTPVPFQLPSVHSNPISLEAAVDASAEVLNSTSKVVLLVGPRIRDPAVKAAVLKFADASEVRKVFIYLYSTGKCHKIHIRIIAAQTASSC